MRMVRQWQVQGQFLQLAARVNGLGDPGEDELAQSPVQLQCAPGEFGRHPGSVELAIGDEDRAHVLQRRSLPVVDAAVEKALVLFPGEYALPMRTVVTEAT